MTTLPVGIITEISLTVEDALKAAQFYMDLFGFTPVGEVSELRGELYISDIQIMLLTSIRDDRKIQIGEKAAIQRTTREKGRHHLCFAILEADFEAWERRLADKGIELTNKIEWPEGGRSLYFNDLDGHELEVKTSNWDGSLYQSVQPTRVFKKGTEQKDYQ